MAVTAKMCMLVTCQRLVKSWRPIYIIILQNKNIIEMEFLRVPRDNSDIENNSWEKHKVSTAKHKLWVYTSFVNKKAIFCKIFPLVSAIANTRGRATTGTGWCKMSFFLALAFSDIFATLFDGIIDGLDCITGHKLFGSVQLTCITG